MDINAKYFNAHSHAWAPHDAQLSVEELRGMVGREGETFSNRVLHYATSLRGTRQYWFKQRSRLIAMVDTLGLPTVFFTHSAADLQWPELARLICCDNPDSSSARNKAVQENPAIADWFFYQRIVKFIDAFYVGVLGATDYWFRFEWQHRGSPHVHGLAWLPDAPNVEEVLSNSDIISTAAKEALLQYVDKIVTTLNPAVLPDGSNVDEAPPPKTNPHICNLRKWRTLTRTWLTSSPHVSDTPVALQPTAYALAMANKSADLDIPNLYSLKQLLSQKMTIQFC